jgi:hypothetical protein
MYKYVLLMLLIILNNAQSEAQISINASGKDISNQYGSISYSIGEVFYVQKGSQQNLTEGIQNSMSVNSSKSKLPFKISIYPNPTSDIVHFNFQNTYSINISYKLYNNIGNELLNGSIQNISSKISLTHLPASIYFLKVFMEQQEVESIKIIKIN